MGDETDDIIRVVSPEQNAELMLDNDKIADYYANYSKGYSVRKGYFGMGDIYMMNAPTIEWDCENGRYYQLFIADNPAFEDAEVFLTTKQSLKIENLIPGKRYFWKVRVNLTNGEEKTSKTYSFYTKGNVRTITLDGVSNSRDLGGIRNAENKSVKFGLIYRSANLDSVTEEGIKEAKRLGIKTDLDLRGGEAPAVSPLGSNVNLIVKNAPSYTGAPSGINGTQEYKDALRDEIKLFAYEENYPILFHCQIGRDRTGTLAMFILAICGVEKEAIIKEYELSYFSAIATDGAKDCPEWIDYTCYFLGELCPEYKTLSEQAAAYAISLGVTEEEIAAIKRIVLG
ncbi:MAG: tyrosine-protein phosphatase [Eubacteriales bacterium]|nr:tyrosine-protein phosphatase [Eubacteriales bacterium]